MKMKTSKEAHKTKYAVRASKRIIHVVIWLFVLFLLVMFIIKVAPIVWNWAIP